MVTPGVCLDPALDVGFRLNAGSWVGLNEYAIRCDRLVEHSARELDTLVNGLQVIRATDCEAVEGDVGHVAGVRGGQSNRAAVVAAVSFQDEVRPGVEIGGS